MKWEYFSRNITLFTALVMTTSGLASHRRMFYARTPMALTVIHTLSAKHVRFANGEHNVTLDKSPPKLGLRLLSQLPYGRHSNTVTKVRSQIIFHGTEEKVDTINSLLRKQLPKLT